MSASTQVYLHKMLDFIVGALLLVAVQSHYPSKPTLLAGSCLLGRSIGLRFWDTADRAHNVTYFVVLRSSIWSAHVNSNYGGPQRNTIFMVQEGLYVYAYSNEIHNVATNVLLTQQLFTVLFFLVKFKTLGLTVEPRSGYQIMCKGLV